MYGNRGFKRWGWLLAVLVLFVAGGQARAYLPEPPPSLRGVEGEARQQAPLTVQEADADAGILSNVVDLPAVADTYIASGFPNSNFGSDVGLFLGYHFDDYGAERILLRFDLSSLPENAVVQEAHLRLYLYWADPWDDEPMPTLVRRLDSAWDETAVTWNLEPTWGDIYTTAEEVTHEPGYHYWELTELVTDWVTGIHPNHGLLIIGDEEIQQRERAFASRESSDYPHPWLRVTYTVIDDDEPPVVSVEPLPTYVPRTFTVIWSGSDPGDSGIAYYDVRYRVDGGAWQEWQMGVEHETANFTGAHGRFYEFQARGVDYAGNVEPWAGPEASTTVDAHPPDSTIDPLPGIVGTTTFPVSWTGDDGGASPIVSYDVRYQYNHGPWILWLEDTTLTTANFTATQGDGIYGFEVRAVNEFGRIELFQGEAEASTIVDAEPPFIEPRLWLPLVLRQAP